MSELTYFAIQFVILLAYGCWVAYRAGYSRGQQATIQPISRKVFKQWKDIK